MTRNQILVASLAGLMASGWLAPGLRAQISDTDVARARAAVGSKIIRCSPDGGGEAMLPIQALAQLKRGMELVLLPGDYQGQCLEIVADRVVVRGEGLGKCEVDLSVTGKDCIIRNLWCNDLRLPGEGGVTVIDSVLRGVDIGGETRRKSQHGFYNCCLQFIVCGSPDGRVDMRRCTLIADELPPGLPLGGMIGTMLGQVTPITCHLNTELNIADSVLYSQRLLFGFYGYARRQPKLDLCNNLMYGKSGLGQANQDGAGVNVPRTSFDLKDLKRQARISASSDNLVEEPKFMAAQGQPGEGDPRRRFADHWRRPPARFQLAPDSPGQGRGIIVAEHPFLASAAPPPAAPPEPAPEAKTEAEAKPDPKPETEWPTIPDGLAVPPPPPPPPG